MPHLDFFCAMGHRFGVVTERPSENSKSMRHPFVHLIGVQDKCVRNGKRIGNFKNTGRS
jgi:hypothetical protein